LQHFINAAEKDKQTLKEIKEKTMNAYFGLLSFANNFLQDLQEADEFFKKI